MKTIIYKTLHHRLLRISMILLLSSGFSLGMMAQNISITGVVTDGTGETVPGATVVVQGTTNGTAADMDGKYTISAPSDATLVVSSIGYKKQLVPVDGRTTINVVIKTDQELLDEVVVIGYGTIKKSHVTGAVAKVGGEDVAAVQATRVDDALAGKMSGVLIQNQDGEPGADPKITIRAANSVSGDAGPLVVVDGFPISGSLATVNPNDIESIEVLKDAASAAIYGSRGANGVILVTTKKGEAGGSAGPSVSYNAYLSISDRYVKDNLNMTAGEYAEEARANIANGTFDVSALDQDVLDYRLNAFANAPDVLAVEDWLFRTGVSNNHDVAVSGGSENVSYRASLGYLNTEGVAINQSFEKYNARLNVDAKLSDKFKAGVNINGFMGDREMLGHDMRDILRSYNISPVYHTAESIAFVQALNDEAVALGLDPFDDGFRGGDDAPWNSSIDDLTPGMTAQDWHYGRSGNGIGGSGDAGPATKLDNTERTQQSYFANVNTYLSYSISDNLTAKTVLGGDLNDSKDYFYRGLEFDSQARGAQTALDQTDLKTSSVLSETTLNYSKVLSELHEVSAVAGYEFQNIYRNGVALNGTNVPFGVPINFGLLNPADITVTEREETIARNSVFGRVNYAYDNRYLASISVRNDGDSRFGENNRRETFPAISLGWNVHNEDFYKSEFLTDLKLRLSRGTLGTTAHLDAYSSLSLLSPQATVFGTGYLIPSEIANPDLTWQTNTETNYGANLGFLGNRFTVGVDYYTSDIEDMLLDFPISEVFGTPSSKRNVGDVTSSGLELELGAALISKADLKWSVSANMSTVDTEITALDNLDQIPDQQYGQSGRGPIFRNYIGGQIGEMWGIETTGEVEMVYLSNPTEFIGQESGWSYAVDQQSEGEEGYGVIDRTRTVEEGGDLVKIGQNTPDFYWGFNSQVAYKAFDMAFQLQGAHGGEVYNIDPLYYGSQWGRGLHDSFDADDDGRADNNGKLYVRNRDQTDAMIQDASYVALRNLTIGYTLKPKLIEKTGLASARVYVASSNLLYLMASDYTSYNPEGVEITNDGYAGPTTYGVQVGASPVVRTFTLGLNVNF